MKILIINPNSDEETDERLRRKAAAYGKGDYEVDVVHVKAAPKLVATMEDCAKGLPEMMEYIRQGNEYDAFIVACHSDPNLDVLKTMTDKPVVGIAEASMKIASMYCNGFAVISPSPASIRTCIPPSATKSRPSSRPTSFRASSRPSPPPVLRLVLRIRRSAA